MKSKQPETIALILGAGFSKCAEIPLQAEFPSYLLSEDFSSHIDRAISAILAEFMADVFGWKVGGAWPTLEDIFTFIDLSTSSGHHLGIKYTPKLLRAIRRMAIHRVFSVLDQRFRYSSEITRLLEYCLDSRRVLSGIVVLNWDIALEKHLSSMLPGFCPDYCCDAQDWNRRSDSGRLGPRVKILKVHGSSNWVYCENCGALFYDLNEKLSLRTKVGLIKHDFRLFNEKFTGRAFNRELGIAPNERKCRRCKNMVSSHIATFSYRKSFRTHAFSQIWHNAFEILAASNRWVFVGYSLPKADFELKHLLKCSQLMLAHLAGQPRRRIDVVSKGDAARAEYESFFGAEHFHYYSSELAGYVSQLSV